MSVFFAKIIRLQLRKLFNDLSLTRTRFGRLFFLPSRVEVEKHVQFLLLLKNNIIIKQAQQQKENFYYRKTELLLQEDRVIC